MIDILNDPRRQHHVDINYDICQSCGKCYHTCIYGVYRWNREENKPEAAYPEECAVCRQCECYCPAHAIDVKQPEIVFYDALFDPLGMND